MVTVDGSAIEISTQARAMFDTFLEQCEELHEENLIELMEKAYRMGVAHERHRVAKDWPALTDEQKINHLFPPTGVGGGPAHRQDAQMTESLREEWDAGCVGCGKPGNYRLMLPGGYFAAVCEGSPACEAKARDLWQHKELYVTHDKKYGTRQAWADKKDAEHEKRRDPELIDVVEYLPRGFTTGDEHYKRWIATRNQLEYMRVLFLECWHCKAALEEPDAPAHCPDCGVTDEEYIDWEEWKSKGSAKTKKVTVFPNWITVAYLWDRREQYKPSSGTYAAFDELIGHFSAGDHIKAWHHGELDDLKKNALNCIKKAPKDG